MTVLSTAESVTGWVSYGSGGAGAIAIEPDYFVQGSNCISRGVTGAATNKGSTFGPFTALDFSVGGTHAGKLIYIWLRSSTPGLCDTKANGGVRVLVGSGAVTPGDAAGVWSAWYVDGSDTLTATDGWKMYVLDPTLPPSTSFGGGVDLAAITYIGGVMRSTGTVKGQNFGVDQIAYGLGELRCRGTNTTEGKGFKEMADAVKFTVDTTNKLFIVKPGITSFDVLVDLYSDAKEHWLADSVAIGFDFPIRAVGGNPLPGANELGRTFFLANDWKIRPDEVGHQLNVNGNLYSEDGSNPYVPTLGNFNVFVNSTVSNLVDAISRTLPEFTHLKYMIEGLRSSHRAIGETIYVDPVNGDDALEGDTPETAVLTFDRAHDLAVSGRGDVINFSSINTTVTITETLVVSKDEIHVRGTGRQFNINTNGATAITVDGDNCSISGLTVVAVDNNHGIIINGDHCMIEDTAIESDVFGTNNGLTINGGGHHMIKNCHIHTWGGDGIKIFDAQIASGAPKTSRFEDCHIYANAGNGISISAVGGTSTKNMQFYRCSTHTNTGWGITIGSNVKYTIISEDTIVVGSTAGNVQDNGTDTADMRTKVTIDRIDANAVLIPAAL